MAYSGNIGGAAGITLNAPGAVQTLAGGVSYTGATTVTAGTLSVTGVSALSTSPFVAVSSGAMLDVSQLPGGLVITGGTLSGGRPSSPNVDINGNAALNNSLVIVAGGQAGTLTVGGGLSLGGGTESFFPGDQITTTGALTLGGTDYVMPTVPLITGTARSFARQRRADRRHAKHGHGRHFRQQPQAVLRFCQIEQRHDAHGLRHGGKSRLDRRRQQLLGQRDIIQLVQHYQRLGRQILSGRQSDLQ